MKTKAIIRALDTVLVIAVVFAVLVALVWFIHTFDVFKLPKFIDDIFESESTLSADREGFEEELLKVLSEQTSADLPYDYVTLSSDKALDLIKQLAPASDFFWNVKTTVTDGSASRTQLHSIYKSNGKVRIDTPESGANFTTVISNGRVYTLNNETGKKTSFAYTDDFTYLDIINIADLESSLASEQSAFESIAIAEINGEKYLYVQTPEDDMKCSYKYFLSLEHALVLYASASIGGIEYFTQETVAFDSDSIISDDAFDDIIG